MFYEIRNITRVFAGLGIELPKESQDAAALAEAILNATHEPAGADLNASILDGTTTIDNIADKLRETAVAMLAAERIPNDEVE